MRAGARAARGEGQALRVFAALAGVAFGLILAWALGQQAAGRADEGVSGEYSARRDELLQEQAHLLAQIDELEGRAALLSARAGEGGLTHAREEWAGAQQRAGLTDVRGPGVHVVLDDAPREAIRSGDDINLYIVHDVDVLRVVNILRGAGAEAISINGERLLANSRIRCGGPTIRVRDRAYAPPFVIIAIGDPERLHGALTTPDEQGGMSELEILRFFGVHAEVTRKDEVQVQRYIGVLKYDYAEAAR